MGSMTPTSSRWRAGRQPARQRAAPVGTWAGRIARAPVARRTLAELGYCALAFPLGLLLLAPLLSLLVPGVLLTATLIGAGAGLLLLVLVTRGCRAAGAVYRGLAARLLGTTVAGPAPFRRGRGVLGRFDARLRDGAGWRAAAYLLLRLPLAAAGLYLVAVPWASGAYYLSYPFWWIPLRRGQGAASAALPAGSFHVRTPADAIAVGLIGAAVLLAAPWTTRLVVVADLWLMGRLLGRSGGAERIRELEASRAVAVDDAAATLRRVERDLHDGAQARLVALAMHLGRAREQLGRGDPAGLAGPGTWSTPRPRARSRPSPSCARWPAASTRPPWTAGWRTRWPASRPAAPSRRRWRSRSPCGRPRPSRPSPTSAWPNC